MDPGATLTSYQRSTQAPLVVTDVATLSGYYVLRPDAEDPETGARRFSVTEAVFRTDDGAVLQLRMNSGRTSGAGTASSATTTSR